MMSTALPLAGKRVVVTQASHQAPELAALLATQGAEPLLYPCIAIEPPPDTRALDGALADLCAGRFAWVVLTSANTVRALAGRVQASELPRSIGSKARVAAIGAATAEAAADLLGCAADLVASDSAAEGLAETLLRAAQPGQRVLLPQGDLARSVLQQALTAGGLEVVSVVAYCTTIGSGGVDLPALLKQPRAVDAITFTSSSTVRNLLRRLEEEGDESGEWIRERLAGVCLAAIGRVTAQTLRDCGLPVSVVAEEQSLEGLVAVLVRRLLKQEKEEQDSQDLQD